MSAYLQRLLDTTAPATSAAGGPAELAPTARSASPIFEHDQRLGLAGFEELAWDTGFATDAPVPPLDPGPPGPPMPAASVRGPSDPLPPLSFPMTAPDAGGDPTPAAAHLRADPLRAPPMAPPTEAQPEWLERPGAHTVPGPAAPEIAAERETHPLAPGEPLGEKSRAERVGPERPVAAIAPELTEAPRLEVTQRPLATPLALSVEPPQAIVAELPGLATAHPALAPRPVETLAPMEATPSAPDIETGSAPSLRPVEDRESLRPRQRVDPADLPAPPSAKQTRQTAERPRVTIDQLTVELLPDPPAKPDVANARPMTAEAVSVIGPLRSRHLARRLIALRHR